MVWQGKVQMGADETRLVVTASSRQPLQWQAVGVVVTVPMVAALMWVQCSDTMRLNPKSANLVPAKSNSTAEPTSDNGSA